MRIVCTSLVCAAALGLSLAASITPADARRDGGRHFGGGHARHMHTNVNRGRNITRNRSVDVNRNVTRKVDRNRNITRNIDRDRRYVWHNGRRGYWRNGVFIVVPAVAGATYIASCAYEYNRWQSTGSSYWRDRYYACAQ